jgi:dTDP-4-amino-4,6-dideoxygalactose transaminase
MKIPFLSLKEENSFLEESFLKGFGSFLEGGRYILGENVNLFEQKFATYTEEQHAVGLANGLDALIIALSYYKFKRDSEVIVPANTYYASILAIIKAGLKPVLVEPNYADFLIDTTKIESKITSKTVAILAVTLYGKMCDFNTLGEICKAHKLKLIVDAAQSHGAMYENSKKCKNADITAYSFYPSKNLGALSDAGALVTSDEQVAAFSKKYRNYGSSVKYVFEEQGINSRLSELQAIFLIEKLKYLDENIAKRRSLAKRYLDQIENTKIILPPSNAIDEDAWHLFVVRTAERKSLCDYLSSKEIGYEIHYPIPPHKQKALASFSKLKLPITENIHETVVSLPLNSSLNPEQATFIINALNDF